MSNARPPAIFFSKDGIDAARCTSNKTKTKLTFALYGNVHTFFLVRPNLIESFPSRSARAVFYGFAIFINSNLEQTMNLPFPFLVPRALGTAIATAASVVLISSLAACGSDSNNDAGISAWSGHQ